MNQKIDANAGHITIHSRNGPITIGNRLQVNGVVGGEAGDIMLDADGGDVIISNPVFLRGGKGGGILSIASTGNVTVKGVVRGDTKANAGSIEVDAGGDLLVDALLNVNGENGKILLRVDGDIAIAGILEARGTAATTLPGRIDIGYLDQPSAGGCHEGAVWLFQPACWLEG